MKIRKLFLAAALILAVFAGCASSGGGTTARAPVELPPIPEGAERVMLDNGSYVIYRFDLPAGAKWSDYNRLTADYMVDEVNIAKKQRNAGSGATVRLMGSYNEEHFPVSGRSRICNLDGDFNGPYIMDNTPRSFAEMGAVANEWFTVEYNITGSAGHVQFKRENIPAANATGPFFFGIGIPGMDEGRRAGIVQLIRNVTLHHASNPALNVVSTGSGFAEPAFLSYYPVSSTREKPGE